MQRAIIQEDSDSVGLFISLLVRYPEISFINYEPNKEILRLSFVIDGVMQTEQQEELKEQLMQLLLGHANLIQTDLKIYTINIMTVETHTFIEISRDLDTITREEISLLILFLSERYSESLISDSEDSLQEDDLHDQEDLIGFMLENFRDLAQHKKLFAYREDGKVLVFNE